MASLDVHIRFRWHMLIIWRVSCSALIFAVRWHLLPVSVVRFLAFRVLAPLVRRSMVISTGGGQ